MRVNSVFREIAIIRIYMYLEGIALKSASMNTTAHSEPNSVLLIEDDSILQYMIVSLLEALHYTVSTATNIAEGKALGDTTTLADPAVVAKLKADYEEGN